MELINNNKCCKCLSPVDLSLTNDGYYNCNNKHKCENKAKIITNIMLQKFKCNNCNYNLQVVDNITLNCFRCKIIYTSSEDELRNMWLKAYKQYNNNNNYLKSLIKN